MRLRRLTAHPVSLTTPDATEVVLNRVPYSVLYMYN